MLYKAVFPEPRALRHSSPPVDHIADALEAHGFILLTDALPASMLSALIDYYSVKEKTGFNAAGIGRHQSLRLDQTIRADLICWIEPAVPAIQDYLQWMHELRVGLNRLLFLGLNSYECHLALYPEGAFYKKHFDAFNNDNPRKLSSVLYLNRDWQAEYGGELVLYDAKKNDTVLKKIIPALGSMILFLSKEFPHEVKPASKPRRSITGWFRTDGSP
jgi:SM-20-related protein